MKKHLIVVIAATLLASCNASSWLGFKRKSDVNSDGVALPRDTGCLQGVVTDGLTGARVDLAGEGKVDAFFVLVSPDQYYASPLLSDGDAATYPNLVGEYTLCGVPVEGNFPLYATVPGYLPFEAQVLIPSSDASQGEGAHQDVLSQIPTLKANIRLFPVAAAGQDYKVIVSYNGAPLEGAMVELMPTGSHIMSALNPADGYLQPHPTGFKTLKGTSDAAGTVTFPAADLALGAVYYYLVVPADPSLQTAKAGFATVGYVTQPIDPYTLYVDLAQVNSELVIVSSSTQSNAHQEDGSLKLVFNRPIELVPDSIDGVGATLSGATQAALADNVAGNKASEQVDVAISGETMVLKPKFKTAPKKADESGLEITYSGLTVRPTSGQKLLHTLSISETVVFYGGAGANQTLTDLVMVSGNDQSAAAGASLPAPLVVRAVDQFGEGMPGVQVTFAVQSGGGSVGGAVMTDEDGLAETDWTLGSAGTQTVHATADGLADKLVVFTAEFSELTSIELASGNDQVGLATGPLADPLVARALDQNGNPMAGVTLTFTVDDLTNGGTIKSTGAADTEQDVMTDAQGEASVTWIMGTVAGGYAVNVTSGAVPQQSFTAETIVGVLAKTSGDAQTANANTALTNPIVVTVTNMATTLPVAGVKVRFSTATAGGLLRESGGTAADTVLIETNAMGQASALWTLGNATATMNSATVEIEDTPGVAQVTFTATTN